MLGFAGLIGGGGGFRLFIDLVIVNLTISSQCGGKIIEQLCFGSLEN